MANSRRAHPIFHPKSRKAAKLEMTVAEFRAAFPAEGDLIEFKAGVGAKAIQRTTVAFSNTDGGVLLIGVEDDGTIRGRALTASVEDDITRAILDTHDPGRYWFHEVRVDGLPVTVVSVARRTQGFAQTPDGQVIVRRGANSVPLLGADLLQFLSDRALRRFDTTDSEVRFADASPELIEEVRRAYGWRAGRALDDRLRGEGLLVGNGTPTLTVAGALSLLDDPATALGKAYVEVMRYPDDGVDYDKRTEIRGSVQRQVAAATEAVMNELGTDMVISGVRRLELPKVPEVVVREAIANAVAHRSYEELGRSVRIEIRPDRVAIISPGGLPEPVTEENIRETQFARNIRVIRLLRRLRLAEDSGRGVDVMIDSMAAALLDPPKFHDLEHSVEVVLPIRGAISPRERAWLLEVERLGVIAPRDRVLLVHAARGEELTNERVRELLGVDSRDARHVLRRLRDNGFLEQLGERGGARYILAGDVDAPMALRMSPRAIRKLVIGLASDGPITNAMVREATGLDRVEALRVLDSLVDEGQLIRRGARRGSHYVRG